MPSVVGEPGEPGEPTIRVVGAVPAAVGATDHRGPRPGGPLDGYHFWADLRALIVAVRDNVSRHNAIARSQARYARHQVV